ncbi:DHH1, partial [Symbiodinium sp. KB8]
MAPLRNDVSLIDIAAHFAPDLIGRSLSKLWTARGCELETALTDAGCMYTCPLTSSPITSPLLVSDGCIYEEEAALHWFRTREKSDKSVASKPKQALRLGPLAEAVEAFLQHCNAAGYRTSEQLEQAMGEAEMPGTPWLRRVAILEASLAEARTEAEALRHHSEEAQALLESLRRQAAEKQELAARRLQRAVRSRIARERQRAAAALCLQRWWRNFRKSDVKKPKKRRGKAQKKGSAKPAKPSAEELPAQLPASATPTPPEYTQFLNKQHQQYARIEEKDKRAVLDFFLDQLMYDSTDFRILIVTSSDERALGLRKVLQMSKAVQYQLVTMQQDEESKRFKELRECAGIISESQLRHNEDASAANMMVNFDMPQTLEDYMDRIRRVDPAVKVMSLPTSPEEMGVIRQVEEHFGIVFRNMEGVARFKILQNRKALRNKLAATGRSLKSGCAVVAVFLIEIRYGSNCIYDAGRCDTARLDTSEPGIDKYLHAPSPGPVVDKKYRPYIPESYRDYIPTMDESGVQYQKYMQGEPDAEKFQDKVLPQGSYRQNIPLSNGAEK